MVGGGGTTGAAVTGAGGGGGAIGAATGAVVVLLPFGAGAAVGALVTLLSAGATGEAVVFPSCKRSDASVTSCSSCPCVYGTAKMFEQCAARIINTTPKEDDFLFQLNILRK